MTEIRTLHLVGATGAVTTTMHDGREHLVVPVVALVEGVIHAVNAETPELVPLATLKKAAASWNGRPVTIGHPKKDGKQCSAEEPGVLALHGIGVIRNSRVEKSKILQDALIDKARVKRLDPNLYARLMAGESDEVSVGAMVVTDKKPGTWTNGKKYMASWTTAEGDHLAFLPGGRGACSVEMGCGTHRAAMRVCGDAMELEVLGPLADKSEVEEEDGMKVGDTVKVNKPGDDAHGKTGKIMSSTKGGTVHKVGDLGQFHQSELRAAETSVIDPETLKCLRDIPQSKRDKMDASDFAGPDQSFPIQTQADVDAASHLVGKAKDPAAVKARIISIAKRKGLTIPKAWRAAEDATNPEEIAELIAYKAMRAIWDACDPQWDQVSDMIDALILDETDDPTESDDEEVAEEQIETARIESIRTILQGVAGSISGLISLTYGQSLSDQPRYNEADLKAAAGASISAKNASVIQNMHDQTMALGAQCDRSNFKMMEEKPKNHDRHDPVTDYIKRVQLQRAK